MTKKDICKSFSYEEYQLHIKKLQKQMKNENCDVLLLSSPENVYYATGYRTWYTSSFFRPVFTLVPQQGEPAIILRILEKSTVRLYSWVENIYCWGTPSRNIGELEASSVVDAFQKIFNSIMPNVKTIGLEAGDGLHYCSSLNLLDEIKKAFKDFTFIDGTLAIQKARMSKTPWEIERIKEACKITEKAIDDTAKEIVVGKTTEKDIAKGISARMCAGGIDKISYLTIISGEEKYSTFNAYATDRIIQENEIVLVDISGHIDGYASDLTRVYYTGTLNEEQRAMAELSAESILAGQKALKPGVSVSQINKVCEDVIKNSKYKDYLVHSSGHGIGLNVVEFPMIGDDCHIEIEEGMTFALEQGVYPFPLDKGAEYINQTYRCEDEVVVTKDGAEWLSGPGKAIIELK